MEHLVAIKHLVKDRHSHEPRIAIAIEHLVAIEHHLVAIEHLVKDRHSHKTRIAIAIEPLVAIEHLVKDIRSHESRIAIAIAIEHHLVASPESRIAIATCTQCQRKWGVCLRLFPKTTHSQQ